jgi:hypothetical protein
LQLWSRKRPKSSYALCRPSSFAHKAAETAAKAAEEELARFLSAEKGSHGDIKTKKEIV